MSNQSPPTTQGLVTKAYGYAILGHIEPFCTYYHHHRSELQPYLLSILEAIPEAIHPSRYQVLLPVLTSTTSQSEVSVDQLSRLDYIQSHLWPSAPYTPWAGTTWEQQRLTIRSFPESDPDPTSSKCGETLLDLPEWFSEQHEGSIAGRTADELNFSSELCGTLLSVVSTLMVSPLPLSSEQITHWYVRRARTLLKVTGFLGHSLWLLQFGIQYAGLADLTLEYFRLKLVKGILGSNPNSELLVRLLGGDGSIATVDIHNVGDTANLPDLALVRLRTCPVDEWSMVLERQIIPYLYWSASQSIYGEMDTGHPTKLPKHFPELCLGRLRIWLLELFLLWCSDRTTQVLIRLTDLYLSRGPSVTTLARVLPPEWFIRIVLGYTYGATNSDATTPDTDSEDVGDSPLDQCVDRWVEWVRSHRTVTYTQATRVLLRQAFTACSAVIGPVVSVGSQHTTSSTLSAEETARITLTKTLLSWSDEHVYSALFDLQVFYRASRVLQHYDINIPVREWVRTLEADPKAQHRLLVRWLRAQSRPTSKTTTRFTLGSLFTERPVVPSEETWCAIVGDIMQLHQDTPRSIPNVLVKLKSAELWTEILHSLLIAGQLPLVSTLVNPKDHPSPPTAGLLSPLGSVSALSQAVRHSLGRAQLETIVVNVAWEFFDNAETGIQDRGLIELASQCLDLVPTTPRVDVVKQLITAAHTFSTLQRKLPEGMLPILPIQIHLATDRWILITRLLHDTPGVYRQVDQLETLVGCLGYDGDQPWVRIRLLVSRLQAAIKQGDTDSVGVGLRQLGRYRTTLTTLDPTVGTIGERSEAMTDPIRVLAQVKAVCLATGRQLAGHQLTLKQEALRFALAISTPEELLALITEWRNAETEYLVKRSAVAQRVLTPGDAKSSDWPYTRLVELTSTVVDQLPQPISTWYHTGAEQTEAESPWWSWSETERNHSLTDSSPTAYSSPFYGTLAEYLDEAYPAVSWEEYDVYPVHYPEASAHSVQTDQLQALDTLVALHQYLGESTEIKSDSPARKLPLSNAQISRQRWGMEYALVRTALQCDFQLAQAYLWELVPPPQIIQVIEGLDSSTVEMLVRMAYWCATELVTTQRSVWCIDEDRLTVPCMSPEPARIPADLLLRLSSLLTSNLSENTSVEETQLASCLRTLLRQLIQKQDLDLLDRFMDLVHADAELFIDNSDYQVTTLQGAMRTLDPDIIHMALRMVDQLGLSHEEYLKILIAQLVGAPSHRASQQLWEDIVEPFTKQFPQMLLEFCRDGLYPKMRSQAQLTQQRFFTLYIQLVDVEQHPWLHRQLQLRLQLLDVFQSIPELTTLDLEALALAALKDRTVSDVSVGGSVLPHTWNNVRQVIEPCCVRLASLDWLTDLVEAIAGLAPLSLADDPERILSFPGNDEVASLRSKLPLWLVENWLRETEDTTSVVTLFDGIQSWIHGMLPVDLLSLAHGAVTFDQPELTVMERCALLKAIQITLIDKGHQSEPFTLIMAYGQFLDQLTRLRDPFTMGKLPGDILSQWTCYYGRDLDSYVSLLSNMAQQEHFTYLVCQTALSLQSQYFARCPGDQPSACDLLIRVYSGDVDQSITTWTTEKLAEQLTLILGPTELVGTNFGDDRLETCLAGYQSYWVVTLRGWLADDGLSCQHQLIVMQALRKIPGAIHNQDRELALFNMRLLIQAHWDHVVTHAEVATVTSCAKVCQRLIRVTREQGKPEIINQQVGALFTVLRTGSDSAHNDDVNEAVEQGRSSPAKVLDATWVACWSAYFTLLVNQCLYECLAVHWLLFSNRYQVDSDTEWQLLTTPFGEGSKPSGVVLTLGVLARYKDNFQRGLTQLVPAWDFLDPGHRDLVIFILCVRQHCHRLFTSDFRWSKTEFVTTVLRQFPRIPPVTFLGGRTLSHPDDNSSTPTAKTIFPSPVQDSVDHWALYSALGTLSSAQPQLTQVWEDLLYGYLQLPTSLCTQQLPLSKLHQALVSALHSRYLPILQQVTLEACQEELTHSVYPPLVTFKCALIAFTLAEESLNTP